MHSVIIIGLGSVGQTMVVGEHINDYTPFFLSLTLNWTSGSTNYLTW